MMVLGGCASITRGTTEDVTVQSEPADAKITTSIGQSCPQSPCVVKVARRIPFTAYAEREGYQPGQLYVDTQISSGGAAGMGGNLLIGGIIGVAIDASSGAMFDHFPNPAVIILQPLGSENPAQSGKDSGKSIPTS
jgi:hypothetical protein